ncbi:MAG: putative Ig domain-containing protein [Alphaproteobacteria bacterium]|nr:putative Ig domain-containing protein [Alphaproteobacteria bacterium]
MSISPSVGSDVVKPGQQVRLISLFNITPSPSNPAYLIVSGLDRSEYTAANTGVMGNLSGNGVTQNFTRVPNDTDGNSVGIVFTYNAATGQYTNATYGNLAGLTYTASANTNENVSLSIFGTNYLPDANAYVNDPYTLSQNPQYFSYGGTVSVVTQPNFAGPVPTQATASSVCAAAASFVGKAWNQNGCWVLASNIAAEAGASLPMSSTAVGLSGTANGEWIVAYDGPTKSAGSNWWQQVTAGEIVCFGTGGGAGHITTVVSGSGSNAQLIDNIIYTNSKGVVTNAANDGSANDIIIAAAHSASQEFAGTDGSQAVIYELDAPVITPTASSVTIGAKASAALAPMFSAVNPLATQAITQYQIYDTAASCTFSISGVTQSAITAATAITFNASALSTATFLTGTVAGSTTIDVRAYNGSYWGDWQAVSVVLSGKQAPPAAVKIAPPTVTAQTANQTWTQGQTVRFALAANTFTDPQGQALSYTAAQSSGAALPGWLSFNTATETFTGTVPAGAASLSLKVTATDTSGLAASEAFNVTVPLVAPTVTAQTANQTWTQGQTVKFALAANTFTDPQGQALTYTATLSGGAALPGWLSFNAATETFTGTVPTGAAGLTVQVTAKDFSGLTVSETFAVKTPAALAAPKISAQTASQTWSQGQSISFALPAGTFTDPQGQAMTYTAAQTGGAALPSWLSFNARTNTFTGLVPAGVSGLNLQVTAQDTSGLSTPETFSVQTPLPPAPKVTVQTATQTWTQGKAVTFALAANTFTDPLGESLTYTAYQILNKGAAAATWLSFNGKTDTFSGTVPGTASGSLTLEVDATNAGGKTVSETFNVNFQSVTGLKVGAISLLPATPSGTTQKSQIVGHS